MDDQTLATPAAWNARVIDEFRANGGVVGGMFAGSRLLLLTTVGARTGKPRTNPVAYARHGGTALVFGSNAGGPKHPGWFHNLVADPRVVVEVADGAGGVDLYLARAVPLVGDERDRAYQRQAAADAAFAGYQTATSRTIPVVALHRLDLRANPEQNRAVGDQLLRAHAQLRRDLAELRAAVSSTPADLAEVHRRGVAYGDALHLHHTAEDGAFSAFEAAFPQLVPAIDRLRDDHREVAGALTSLAAHLASLIHLSRVGDPADAAVGAAPVVERLRVELDELAESLERHFADEEAQLLPPLSG